MNFERQRGLTYSAALHAFVLFLVIFGLPSMFDRDRMVEPQAITVELLPISTISNVKPSEKLAEKEKPEEAKAQEKPAPPVKAAEESTPPPPAEKPAEVKKPKEPDKKAEKPKDKKEDSKKAKEEDLAAVLKAVKDTAQKDKKEKQKEDGGGKSKSDQYDPTLPMSISEKDAIRSQIAKCWSVPAGAKDAHDLVVVLRLEVAQDGSVIKVELGKDSKSRYASDTFFRAAADSAIRAVKQCSPLQNLPAEKYGTWRDMELTFDPKEMLF